MANTTVKRNLVSDIVILVKARRNKFITATWDTNKSEFKVSPVKEITNVAAATPTVLYTAGNKISQLLDNGFQGQIGVVMTDDATLKAFAIQSRVNKSGLKAAVDYIDNNKGFSWMPEDFKPWILDSLHKVGRELREEDFPDMRHIIDEVLTDEGYKTGREKSRDECWACRGEATVKTVDFLEEKLAELTAKSMNDKTAKKQTEDKK